MQPGKETNFYAPGDSGGAAAGKAGGQSVSWTASEFIEHQRGAGWYLLLFLITAALAAAIYFLTKDYFGAGAIAVAGVIVGVFVGHKPNQVSYQLDSRGITINDKSYSYGTFRAFSVTHDGAVSSVNFRPIKRLAIPISAFFEAKDEAKITNIIGNYLPLEEKDAGGFDRLTRRLKI